MILPPYWLWTLAVAVVVHGIYYFARVSRDKHAASIKRISEFKKASEDFLQVINPIITAIEKTRPHPPLNLYRTTLNDLQRSALGFSKTLSKRTRSGFDEIWKKYTTVDQRLHEPELKQLPGPGAGMGVDYSRGAHTLLPLLKKLRRYAE